ENVRSRMLSIYFIGAPLGSAIGIITGGFFLHHLGWRTPFFVNAIPRIVLAVFGVLVKEPPRQISATRQPRCRGTLKDLFRTRSYLINVLATAAVTFATVGLAYWFPTFLYRMRGWKITQATQLFGATTVVAGIAGTMFGGFIADLWRKENKRAYFYVGAIGMLLAAPLTAAAIFIHGKIW